MKLLQQNKRHLLITAISQLGFLALVCFWVANSYKTEKEQLQREARFFLKEQIITVEQNRWKKALKTFIVDTPSGLTISNDQKDTTVNININLSDSIMVDRIKRGRRKHRKNKKGVTIQGHQFKKEKGFSHLGEKIFLSNEPDSLFMASLDSVLIPLSRMKPFDLKIFERRNFEPQSTSFYTSNFDEKLGEEPKVVAEITNYQAHLFKKILPETFLSLLFLCLTGIAFWLTNRILHKQRMVSEQQKNFMYNMTHELKTPVTTIGLALESLKNNELPDASKDNYLNLSTDSVSRLNALIDRVLGSAKLENGKIELEKSQVDISELLESIVGEHNFLLQETGRDIEIKTNLHDSDLFVYADSYHLRNALNNLVDNALKYSGENPLIEIGAKLQNKTIVVSVKDDGQGIEADQLRYVFDKFYRINNGKQHDVKGFGLGLFSMLKMKKALAKL